MIDTLWLGGILNRSEVNFKIMAFKGTSGKSASGASMSKYDVEVEARLKALEGVIGNIEGMINSLVEQVNELKSHSHDTSAAPAVGCEARVEQLVATLKAKEPGKWKSL